MLLSSRPASQRHTWLSFMPGSTLTSRVSRSLSTLTLSHSSHSWVVYCWYIPGPSWRVTILFLQRHCLFPLDGLITFLLRVTCRACFQALVCLLWTCDLRSTTAAEASHHTFLGDNCVCIRKVAAASSQACWALCRWCLLCRQHQIRALVRSRICKSSRYSGHDRLGLLTTLPLALGRLNNMCKTCPAGFVEVPNLAVVQFPVGLLVTVQESEWGLLYSEINSQ